MGVRNYHGHYVRHVLPSKDFSEAGPALIRGRKYKTPATNFEDQVSSSVEELPKLAVITYGAYPSTKFLSSSPHLDLLSIWN